MRYSKVFVLASTVDKARELAKAKEWPIAIISYANQPDQLRGTQHPICLLTPCFWNRPDVADWEKMFADREAFIIDTNGGEAV